MKKQSPHRSHCVSCESLLHHMTITMMYENGNSEYPWWIRRMLQGLTMSTIKIYSHQHSMALVVWFDYPINALYFAICQVATRVSRNVWSHANHHDDVVPFPYNEWRRWVNLDSTDQWLYIWQLKISSGCWLNTSKQHTLGHKTKQRQMGRMRLWFSFNFSFCAIFLLDAKREGKKSRA